MFLICSFKNTVIERRMFIIIYMFIVYDSPYIVKWVGVWYFSHYYFAKWTVLKKVLLGYNNSLFRSLHDWLFQAIIIGSEYIWSEPKRRFNFVFFQFLSIYNTDLFKLIIEFKINFITNLHYWKFKKFSLTNIKMHLNKKIVLHVISVMTVI